MRVEVGFFALLIVTLGLKAALNDYRVDHDYRRLTADIAERLEKDRFAFHANERPGRPPYFVARSGDCTVFVQSAYAPASLSGAYVRDSAGVGQPFYQIGPVRYASAPSARIWLGDMTQYTLGRFGVMTDRDAPLVIAKSPQCHAGQPDLPGLRLHLAKSVQHQS